VAPDCTAVTKVPSVISMEPSPFKQITLRWGWAKAIPRARSAACPIALSAEAKSRSLLECRPQGRTVPIVVTTTASLRRAAKGANSCSLVSMVCESRQQNEAATRLL
jgi:hypothetical protein